MATESIKEIIEILTVSGGDSIITDDTVTENIDIQTVSGNDSSESTLTNVYIINVSQEQPEMEIQEQVLEPVYTLFDKPLSDYSVSEGLLLILTVLAILKVIWFSIEWAFSWFGNKK